MEQQEPQSRQARDRQILELLKGRGLTPSEVEDFEDFEDEFAEDRDEEDEKQLTLNGYSRALAPRLTEHEWELAAIGEIQAKGEDLERHCRLIVARMRYYLEADPEDYLRIAERELEPGGSEPTAINFLYSLIDSVPSRDGRQPAEVVAPYEEVHIDWESAWRWLSEETESEEGKEFSRLLGEGRHKYIDEQGDVEGYLAWLPTTRYVQGCQALFPSAPSKYLVGPKFPYFSVSLPSHKPEPGDTRGRVLEGIPYRRSFEDEHDVSVLACTFRLQLLALFSAYLSEFSHCWSQGQAALYILTGETPELPRWRIWVDDLLGGGRRAFLELNGTLTYREWREVHRIQRDAQGTYRKKSFTPEDLELILFVDENTQGWSWPKRYEEWKRRHPEDRRRNSASALRKAYQAAVKRRTIS